MYQKKNYPAGIKPKLDPAIFRFSVNMTEIEHEYFRTLFNKSGVGSRSSFIKSRIFNREFKVITIDKNTVDYYTKLTSLYDQFRRIGVNYNQVLKELKSHFSEKKAMALLYKLEKLTIELVKTNRQIIDLTNEFKGKWLQK